jgi:hypothetical protein
MPMIEPTNIAIIEAGSACISAAAIKSFIVFLDLSAAHYIPISRSWPRGR